MEQMNTNMNNIDQGDAGDNNNLTPNDRGAMKFNDSSAAFGGGQINPMAFMSQFPGMMANMANTNPQDMMNMMGAYCQTANGNGAGNGGGMGGFSGFPVNDGSIPQGMNMMNPQAQAMAQMMRKRPMDNNFEDFSPPDTKRANFGNSPAAETPSNENPAAASPVNSPNASSSASFDDDDDDEKQASASGIVTSNMPELAAIPPSKEGIKFYSRNDVLCGRGGGTNVHPGNRSFRDLINANRRAYLKARKNDKPAISRSIVRTIREMNGRFLKKNEKLVLWFEIGDDGAREKTSQALRQRAPEMRKILFEDEQRHQQHTQRAVMTQRQLLMMGQGMGGNGYGQMNPAALMGNMGNFNPGMGSTDMGNPGMGQGMGNQDGAQTGNQAVAQGGNNAEISQSLIAKYNMLHQKNWLAQEKNMILQRLAMSGGLNANNLNGQNNNSENMTTHTLLQQGMKQVTPRGA